LSYFFSLFIFFYPISFFHFAYFKLFF